MARRTHLATCIVNIRHASRPYLVGFAKDDFVSLDPNDERAWIQTAKCISEHGTAPLYEATPPLVPCHSTPRYPQGASCSIHRPLPLRQSRRVESPPTKLPENTGILPDSVQPPYASNFRVLSIPHPVDISSRASGLSGRFSWTPYRSANEMLNLVSLSSTTTSTAVDYQVESLGIRREEACILKAKKSISG